MVKVKLYCRKKLIINTDPQRRCYNGCHFSSKEVWGDWELIGVYSRENAESSLKTFKEINPSWEFKIIED
jgi:hypothetical protein